MKNKLLIILFCSLLIFTACDNGFKELNKAPTEASEIDLGYEFTYALLRTSGERWEAWRTNLIYNSCFVQHLTMISGFEQGDKYLYDAGYSSALFDKYYVNAVQPITDIIEKTKDDPNKVNLYASARILRVFIFHRLTDLYGDIPYFEAGRGYVDRNFAPKYDAQSDIYADMLKELEESALLFDNSKKTFGTADISYQGENAKWEKLAYSMMLRLGLRMVKVDESKAKIWVEKAYNGGVMATIDDDFYIPHTAGPTGYNKNGNGEVFTYFDMTNSLQIDLKMSKTFVDYLKNTADPRLSIYCSLYNGDDTAKNQMGLPNGYDITTIINFDPDFETNKKNYSVPNVNIIIGEDAPMFLITYSEVELMLAEAAVRGWNVGDAKTHYEAGVKAGMQNLTLYSDAATVSDENVNSYLTNNPYDADNALEQINTQYWVTTFLNEYEAFANWRRSGFPVLTPVNYVGNVTGGTIPRRLNYPQSEAGINADNYNEAIARQGADEFTTRIWWDIE